MSIAYVYVHVEDGAGTQSLHAPESNSRESKCLVSDSSSGKKMESETVISYYLDSPFSRILALLSIGQMAFINHKCRW